MNRQKLLYRLALNWRCLQRRLWEKIDPTPIITEPRTIIIAATLLLGDFVMLAPLVQAVRKYYPKAKITVLTPKGWQAVALQMKGVDAAIEAQINSYAWFKQFNCDYHGLWDLGIVPFIYFTLPLFYAVGVKNIRSFPDFRGRNYQIHHKMSAPVNVAHMSRLFLQILDGETETFYPAPHFHSLQTPLLDDLIGQRYVVIHPGARRKVRFWPSDRYIAIANLLLQAGFHIVLTGMTSEKSLTSQIEASLPVGKIHNLAGKDNLMGLMRVIQSAEAVIGPDTGVMHLARALNVPSVTIMGQTQDTLFGIDPHFHDVSRARTLYIPNLQCRDRQTLFKRSIPNVANCCREECLYTDIPCLLRIEVSSMHNALKEIGVL